MSKQNNFIKEDEIKFLNPIEACRKRPSMYIGNPTNANILLKECVENAEDEASLGRAKSIFVNTNFNGGFKIVCDDGAGIPISISQYVEGEVSAAVALINFHAGSKFEASDVSRTGMFGIGLAAVSALSEVTILMSKITSENYDRSTPQVKKVWEEAGPRSKKDLFYIVITEKGEKTYEGAGKLKDLEKMIFKGIKDYDHIPEGQSTIILFRPDPEIFESVEAEAPVMGLSYFLLIQEKFYNRFIEVTLNGQKLINPFSPYKYQFTKRIIPKDNSKNPFIDVYFTFDVDPELGKPVEWGSVNGLDCNGYHIALMKNLYKAAIKDYFKIKHDYILEGLNFGVVILAADCNFSGQIKDNLKSFTRVKIDDFTPVVKEIEKIFKKDEDYWRDHINKLNQLWDARRDIGAIEKAQKMIDNSTGVNMYRNKASYVKGFVDATAGQKDRWNCELFIVEGLSAGQSLISGRPDTKNFAILPLRGKILNVSSKTSDQALDSQTIYSMYNCIGLGIDQNNVLQDCTTYEEAIEPLIKATTDDNAQVRFKAAEILGNMGDVAVDKLINEFNDAEGKDKRFLAFALKETEDKKVIPYFVEALDDEDFGVRKVAVRALGELQADDELDNIAKCLDDEDWGVKLAAIQALGDLASDEAIKLIKDARKTEDDKDFKKSCNKAIKKAQKRQKAKDSGEAIVKVIPMSTIKEMEKTNPQKAIKEYERYVEAKMAKDAPYKRLCVLYRKANDYDNEVRVIETACEVFADNDKKLSYFEKRLAKLK